MQISCPLVTAVIPTRNRSTLVCRAINSVLNQTYTHIEIVVVLDGPDESTTRAVHALSNKRIGLIALPSSVGGGEARNVGIRSAKGKYVALLDDDDVWFPEKIEKQVAMAETCDSANLLVVARYIRSEEGCADEVWPVRLPAAHESLSEFMVSSRCGFQTPVLMASRKLFLQSPFTRGLKKHQDWDWLLRASSQPDFQLRVVDEPLARITVWHANGKGISQQLDWRFSTAWASEALRKGLMTRKAFSLFTAKISLRSARKQGASFPEMLRLFQSMLSKGRPSFITALDAIEAIVFPPEVRAYLRGTRLAGTVRRVYLRH